jgi:hypothetical protein
VPTIYTMKSLLEMDTMPTQVELEASFGEAFKDITKQVKSNINNTSLLIQTGKQFEATNQQDHAALCYALAANQQNRKGCSGLVIMIHKKSKLEAPQEAGNLSDIALEDCHSKIFSIKKNEELVLARIKKQTYLLDQIKMLQYQNVRSLQELFDHIYNVNVSEKNADQLLDQATNQLMLQLPTYEAYLSERLSCCNEAHSQPQQDFIEKIQRMKQRKVVPLETQIKLLATATSTTNQALDTIKTALKADVEITLKTLRELKNKASGVLGSALTLSQYNTPMPSPLNEAQIKLNILNKKMDLLEANDINYPEALNAYRGELDDVYSDFKREQVKGYSHLKKLVDQYSRGDIASQDFHLSM